MKDHDSIQIPSPDGQHIAELSFAGEVRFGPLYYHLGIDEHNFADRVFGDAHLWSSDSRFFAVQEWLTTNYIKGPITQLLIVDVVKGCECAIAQTDKGFVSPTAFKSGKIVYERHYYAPGVSERYEKELATLEGWTRRENYGKSGG